MYSHNVFPLGILSLKQIEKGQEVLNDISKIIDNKNNDSEILSLSNKFFTLIPHISKKIELIETHEILNDKNKLLIYMRNVSSHI